MELNVNISNTLSHLNGRFLRRSRLAVTRISPFWIVLGYR